MNEKVMAFCEKYHLNPATFIDALDADILLPSWAFPNNEAEREFEQILKEKENGKE